MKLIRRTEYNEEDSVMFKGIREIFAGRCTHIYLGSSSKIMTEVHYRTETLLSFQIIYRSNLDATGKMNATKMFKGGL